MFAFDTSYHSVSRSKSRSSLAASLLAFNSKTTNTDIGSAGERLAIAMFEEAGYQARKPKYHGVDLEVRDHKTGEFFTVEVKTANRSESRKSWQFCLNKPKNTCACNSAYILLILIAEKTVFTYLLPSDFLADTKQFTISSHPEKYKGKIAPFRNRGALSFQAACNVYELALLQ